jgi:hypothetical protein
VICRVKGRLMAGDLRAALRRLGERALLASWRQRQRQGELAAAGLPALTAAWKWARRQPDARLLLFFVLGVMQWLPVNRRLGMWAGGGQRGRAPPAPPLHPPPPPSCPAHSAPPPPAAPPAAEPRAQEAPAVEWCHHCTARASETVVHVFECSAAQPAVRRLHGAVAAVVRDSLAGWNISLPPADDRLPLPPQYAALPFAAVLFFFDPVLAAAARRGHVIPGAKRCRSPQQLRAVRAMAGVAPLAGLLGVWPVHLPAALAVCFGLPDPASCRPLRRALRTLVDRLRSTVVSRAFRIYVARCYAERDWLAAAGDSESWRSKTNGRAYSSRGAQLRRQAAAVRRGAPPPAATWASSKPRPAKRALSTKHAREHCAKRVCVSAPDSSASRRPPHLLPAACSLTQRHPSAMHKRAREPECVPATLREAVAAGPSRKQRRAAAGPARVYDLRPAVRAARRLLPVIAHAGRVSSRAITVRLF